MPTLKNLFRMMTFIALHSEIPESILTTDRFFVINRVSKISVIPHGSNRLLNHHYLVYISRLFQRLKFLTNNIHISLITDKTVLCKQPIYENTLEDTIVIEIANHIKCKQEPLIRFYGSLPLSIFKFAKRRNTLLYDKLYDAVVLH